MKYVRCLTVAGSDSGGGAGIQADLKTFAALGVYGLSVLTAVTAQNTREIRAVHVLPESLIADQLECVLSDIGVNAVKIGMIYAKAAILRVATILRANPVPFLTIDPLILAKTGDRLLSAEGELSLREELFPLADLITPNLPELAVLTGRGEITTWREAENAAQSLLELGCRAVLVKGGHFRFRDQESVDLLLTNRSIYRFASPRVKTKETHGTGCTLSAAITAFRAHGLPLPEAVAEAKAYLNRALTAGAKYRLGSGHGPLHHLCDMWN